MYKKIEPHVSTVTIHIDGVPVSAEEGEMVAAVLLRTSPHWSRTNPVSLAPRSPYCLMGACFECLAEVDGVGSVQTCLADVADGMQVRRQSGKRRVVA
jgi:predicted molibdopterin-dependent oxidoreductase YjgC